MRGPRASVALLRQGKQQEALQKLGKAVSVSPWMSTLLIEELKKRSIPFVVAPYEADPQLAFLVKTGTRQEESSAHIHTAAYVFSSSSLASHSLSLSPSHSQANALLPSLTTATSSHTAAQRRSITSTSLQVDA